jgi:hypothetical protein
MEPLQRQRYSDWTTAWKTRSSYPVRHKRFFPLQEVQTYWGLLLPRGGGNRPEREANHSHPSVQVKSECNCTSTPHIRLYGVCGEHLFFFQLLEILYVFAYSLETAAWYDRVSVMFMRYSTTSLPVISTVYSSADPFLYIMDLKVRCFVCITTRP